MEFFRHCPGCGRRFHIKLEMKKMVGEHHESAPGWLQADSVLRRGSISPLLLHEGAPIMFDVEEFQYIYKCGHCGHEWSERHVEGHREGLKASD